MQTRLESLIEAIANAVIGMGVGLASQLFIFYALNIKVSVAQNATMVVWFTFISIARSYVIRRWFNARLKHFVTSVAHKLEH